jgi:hypothetical protein
MEKPRALRHLAWHLTFERRTDKSVELRVSGFREELRVELRVSSFRTSEWGVSGHRNAAARTAAVAGGVVASAVVIGARACRPDC